MRTALIIATIALVVCVCTDVTQASHSRSHQRESSSYSRGLAQKGDCKRACASHAHSSQCRIRCWERKFHKTSCGRRLGKGHCERKCGPVHARNCRTRCWRSALRKCRAARRSSRSTTSSDASAYRRRHSSRRSSHRRLHSSRRSSHRRRLSSRRSSHRRISTSSRSHRRSISGVFVKGHCKRLCAKEKDVKFGCRLRCWRRIRKACELRKIEIRMASNPVLQFKLHKFAKGHCSRLCKAEGDKKSDCATRCWRRIYRACTVRHEKKREERRRKREDRRRQRRRIMRKVRSFCASEHGNKRKIRCYRRVFRKCSRSSSSTTTTTPGTEAPGTTSGGDSTTSPFTYGGDDSTTTTTTGSDGSKTTTTVSDSTTLPFTYGGDDSTTTNGHRKRTTGGDRTTDSDRKRTTGSDRTTDSDRKRTTVGDRITDAPTTINGVPNTRVVSGGSSSSLNVGLVVGCVIAAAVCAGVAAVAIGAGLSSASSAAAAPLTTSLMTGANTSPLYQAEMSQGANPLFAGK